MVGARQIPRGATYKILIIKDLLDFRVVIFTTLKSVKPLSIKRLRDAPGVRQQEAPVRTRPSHYRGALPLVPRAASPHRGNLVAGYNGFGYLHLVQLAV